MSAPSSDIPTERLAAFSIPQSTGIPAGATGTITSASAIPTSYGYTFPCVSIQTKRWLTPADTTKDNDKPFDVVESEANIPTDETDMGPAIYPPILEECKILGYVTDKNGIRYSRDIGRSMVIHFDQDNGTQSVEPYYLFGDTFCKNAQGDYVGIQDQTAAYVGNKAKFLESEYREIEPDGMVKQLVPLNEEEKRLLEENPGTRITKWPFGGYAEVGSSVGAIWYQKGLAHPGDPLPSYCGIGYVMICRYSDGRLIIQDLPECRKQNWYKPDLMFGPDEPKMGSFSTLAHENWVYLWGERPDCDIILGRVYKYATHDPHQYQYWDGAKWTNHWQEATSVFHDIPQGAVVQSRLFGKEKPWLFVGVNKWADSMLQIGASAKLEGPWDLIPLCKAKGIDNDKEFMYCMYPHIWASNDHKQELIVTWSEHCPGGVVGAKLKFKIDEVGAAEEAEERRRVVEATEAETKRLAAIKEAEWNELCEAHEHYKRCALAEDEFDNSDLGSGSALSTDRFTDAEEQTEQLASVWMKCHKF